jgi:hypothetical protein
MWRESHSGKIFNWLAVVERYFETGMDNASHTVNKSMI